MPGKKYTFREVLEAACRSFPDLWHEPDETGTRALNLAAVARHYKERGYPAHQPNLHRLVYGTQQPGDTMVKATADVFGLPRAILRGEPLPEQMERLLGKASLDTLVLAERIEALEHEDYRQLVELLALLEHKREQLRKAIAESPNVRELPRRNS